MREDLGTGYGLRFSAEIYGSKREKTVFHKHLQEACFVLTEISENLRSLREFMGECNLGILCSSSLLGKYRSEGGRPSGHREFCEPGF